MLLFETKYDNQIKFLQLGFKFVYLIGRKIVITNVSIEQKYLKVLRRFLNKRFLNIQKFV